MSSRSRARKEVEEGRDDGDRDGNVVEVGMLKRSKKRHWVFAMYRGAAAILLIL